MAEVLPSEEEESSLHVGLMLLDWEEMLGRVQRAWRDYKRGEMTMANTAQRLCEKLVADLQLSCPHITSFFPAMLAHGLHLQLQP